MKKQKPVYSRTNPEAGMYDRRQFNEYVYTSEVSVFVERIFQPKLKEARKRVSIFYDKGRRFHKYEPSKEYRDALKKFVNNKIRYNGGGTNT